MIELFLSVAVARYLLGVVRATRKYWKQEMFNVSVLLDSPF